MNECTDKWAHQALDKLFVGELEASELGKLRTHAAACDSCRKQYDRVSFADEKLARVQGMAPDRVALMQSAVLERAEQKNEQERAARGKQRWWMPALGFAMAAAVAVAIAYVPKTDDSQFQARGNATNSAFGIRAFCVNGPKVTAEALPGGTLKCAVGNALQLTYTAPKATSLRVDVNGQTPLLAKKEIVSGVDVPLEFSTPITAEWLTSAAQLKATFGGEDGKPAESVITVVP